MRSNELLARKAESGRNEGGGGEGKSGHKNALEDPDGAILRPRETPVENKVDAVMSQQRH